MTLRTYPSDRRLRAGELVALDFGGAYDGYCVHLTRAAGPGGAGPGAERAFRGEMTRPEGAGSR